MIRKCFKKFGAGARHVRVIVMVLCLLTTLMVPLMYSGLNALAEGPITAMHMSSNGETGINQTVAVEKGKTYTFTVLWKYLAGENPDFLLGGDAIGSYKTLILADKAQENVQYDADGRVSYTFVSQGTALEMYGRMGKGLVDAYFAMPTLYESDADGNYVAGGSVIDCDPNFNTSWTKWNYRQECLVSEQVAVDFFKRESSDPITAMRLHEWNTDAGVGNTVAVEKGKTYTFSVLWKYVKGDNPDFTLSGDAIDASDSKITKTLIIANAVQEGAKYDNDGRLSYTFVSQGTSLTMCGKMGSASGEKDVYFADMRLYESDDAGNPVPVSAPIDCDADFNQDGAWAYWGYGGSYRNVVQVAADFFKRAPAALATLNVGYALSPAFAPMTYAYTATVPNTVTNLDIQYTLADGASLKEITGNENFEVGVPKDVVIAVNDTDGGVTNYTITVTRQQDQTGTITAMHLICQTAAGLSNSVTVESGKTYTFSVLYKYVRGVDPSFTLRGNALASEKLLVKCAGVQPDVKYDPDTGKLSYTFTSQGTTLEMYPFMGYGATGETTTAEFYFAKPTLYESDAAGNPVSGGAVIDCDPEFDNSWEKWNYGGDYRRVENVAPDFFKASAATALTTLDVGYPLSQDFNQDIYAYSITVPYTVNELNIQYTLAENATLKEITGNGGFEDGKTKDVLISVNNNQGGTTTYTIHVTREVNPATAITAMHIHEWSDAGVTNTVTVETGKTYTFTFLWEQIKGTDDYFGFSGGAVPGGKKLIIADKPQAGVDYDPVTGKVSYTFKSQSTDLILVSAMGSATGEKDYYFAQPTLYESDDKGSPVTGGAVIDCDPEFDNSWEKWNYGGDYRHVELVRPDFFERTDFPHALTSLDIGYAYSPSFDYRRTIYDVTVPYTVNSLNIQYTLADNATLKEITGNGDFEDGLTKSVVISVNDDAGGVTSYTIRVKREVEPAAALATLDVGYWMCQEK